MNKILEIINIIRINNGIAEIKIEDINYDTKLMVDLGFDSLDLAELTVRIEKEFGVDVFEDGIVTTIGEILEKTK